MSIYLGETGGHCDGFEKSGWGIEVGVVEQLNVVLIGKELEFAGDLPRPVGT